MKKLTSLLLAGVLVAGVLSGCGNTGGNSSSDSLSSQEPGSSGSSTGALGGKVSMSGSTSMEEIAKALAEGFNAKYPDVAIDVQLGGSSTGIKNAQEGVSDIGNVSRALKDTETGLDAETIALDGIALIVNTANPIEDLSTEQILKIYTGEIQNWKDLGGDDAEIQVVGREAGSGTRDGFESVVGIEDNAKHDQELTSTGAVQTAVASTPSAIGYVSLANVDDTVKALKVGGVSPAIETVQDGSYTLQRPFVMVTKTGTELRPEVKAFLEFALGDEGQSIVSQIGLIPLSK